MCLYLTIWDHNSADQCFSVCVRNNQNFLALNRANRSGREFKGDCQVIPLNAGIWVSTRGTHGNRHHTIPNELSNGVNCRLIIAHVHPSTNPHHHGSIFFFGSVNHLTVVVLVKKMSKLEPELVGKKDSPGVSTSHGTAWVTFHTLQA